GASPRRTTSSWNLRASRETETCSTTPSRPAARRRRSRGNPMRITAAVIAAVVLAIIPATAQAPSTPLRTADGKPNLNGIWQAMNEANWDIEAHTAAPGPVSALGGAYAVPPGLGVVEGGEI